MTQYLKLTKQLFCFFLLNSLTFKTFLHFINAIQCAQRAGLHCREGRAIETTGLERAGLETTGLETTGLETAGLETTRLKNSKEKSLSKAFNNLYFQ